MQDVVIVAATRTAVGSFQGSLAGIPAPELGAAVIRRLLEQTGLDAGQVDEVILGQVLTAGSGQNPARQAAIKAGLPVGVPAMTLNKVCGSGLKALHLGAQAIRCGDAEVIVAGGQENMSLAPYVMPGARTGLRMGHAKLVDSMIEDGLWDAFNDYHMGITAENLAEKYGLTREEQDAFAAASQQKAIAAIEGGRFRDEITPIQVPQRKGEPLSFDTDEQPRAGTTVEALAKLKPAFRKDGSVTAGNASSLNDGAAAVADVGDFDVLAYWPATNTLVVVECKYNQPPFSVKDSRRLRDRIFGKDETDRTGQFSRIARRRAFVKEHRGRMLELLKWPPAEVDESRDVEMYVSRDLHWWMVHPPYPVPTFFVAVDSLDIWLKDQAWLGMRDAEALPALIR